MASFHDAETVGAIRAQRFGSRRIERFLALVREEIARAIADGKSRAVIRFDFDDTPADDIARWAIEYERANGVDVFYLDTDGALGRRVSSAIDSDDFDDGRALTIKRPQIIAFDWK